MFFSNCDRTSSVGRALDCRESYGFDSRDQINTQGLKKTEKKSARPSCGSDDQLRSRLQLVLSYLKNIDTQLKRVFWVVVVVAFFPPNSRAFTETTRMYHVLSLRKCRDCYTRDIFLTCPQSFRGPAATSCSTTPLIPPTTQLNTQQAITCYVSKLTNDFKIQRCGGNENF